MISLGGNVAPLICSFFGEKRDATRSYFKTPAEIISVITIIGVQSNAPLLACVCYCYSCINTATLVHCFLSQLNCFFFTIPKRHNGYLHCCHYLLCSFTLCCCASSTCICCWSANRTPVVYLSRHHRMEQHHCWYELLLLNCNHGANFISS